MIMGKSAAGLGQGQRQSGIGHSIGLDCTVFAVIALQHQIAQRRSDDPKPLDEAQIIGTRTTKQAWPQDIEPPEPDLRQITLGFAFYL